MRKRETIPLEHISWLTAYLHRKGISHYPDLDTDQWRMLRGAYRQMLLKVKLSKGSPERYEKILSHNTILVYERDKAKEENSLMQSKVFSLKNLKEEQAHEIKQLKAQLKRSKTPILGQGIYDGSISLAIAVRLLNNVPKDSGKQSALRKQAILECGYMEIGERKLTPTQSVEVYEKIKAILKR